MFSTPRRVTRNREANEQLLYFTSSSLWQDDAHLVFLSDRTGHPNIFVRNLSSGREQQLSRNDEGVLKAYVYFDGGPYRGLGKASVSLHAPSGRVFYIQGQQVLCAHPSGEIQPLATLPDAQMTAFTHVSGDGEKLCVPTTDARALDGDRVLESLDFEVDERVQRENLSSFLRVYSTRTGELLACEEVPRAWITHVQFAPHDSNLVLYNHEWPADCGVRRVWLWDGQSHRALRSESQVEGRCRDDWACHEMWTRDGQHVLYHGKYADGRPFLGRVAPDGSDLREIVLPTKSTRYGHFTGDGGNRLVSDGYFGTPDDAPSGNGAWISLLDVDWNAKRIEWQPLCRSRSSWDSQDSHPHPVFDHAGQSIFFTSDFEGRRAVYCMPVPSNL